MRILTALLLVIPALPAWAQAPAITSVAPLVAPRGTTVTLVGTLPANTTTFWLLTEKPGPPGREPYDCTKNTTETRTRLVSTSSAPVNGVTTFTALVPASLAMGDYTLCASYTGAGAAEGTTQTIWYTVPILGDSGRLQVAEAPGGQAVRVTSVQPHVAYEEADTYSFSVLGDGFSLVGPDNKVLLESREIPVCWNNDSACSSNRAMGTGTATSGRQLDLKLPSSFQGQFKGSSRVQIRVGNNESSSDAAMSVTLARVSRNAPIWIAAVILALLVLLVGGLLGVSKGAHQVAGVQLSLLSALFLDKATDTYSLSRAQFYAWTGAAVFGYSYLTIAWSFLQGRLEFAPIPDNLPGILIASATTATVVVGLNNSKPKGAGSVQPSLADFISTGGMAVPERLQFLVWTVLGVLTFVFLIVMADPATIATLPSIPDRFLYLMGISSAGYVGGRLARKGGPVVDDILAKPSSLDLEIHGRNLSKNAGVQIDGEDVTLDLLAISDGGQRRPRIVAKDDLVQDPTMAKVLSLTVASPKPDWMTRKSNPSEDRRDHVLTIINPDGQKAEWPFSIPGPTAILSAGAGDQKTTDGTLKVSPNAQVTLDASASKAEEGAIVSFGWATDTLLVLKPEATITQVFPTGTHRVTLKVTDEKKLSDTASVTIVVA